MTFKMVLIAYICHRVALVAPWAHGDVLTRRVLIAPCVPGAVHLKLLLHPGRPPGRRLGSWEARQVRHVEVEDAGGGLAGSPGLQVQEVVDGGACATVAQGGALVPRLGRGGEQGGQPGGAHRAAGGREDPKEEAKARPVERMSVTERLGKFCF